MNITTLLPESTTTAATAAAAGAMSTTTESSGVQLSQIFTDLTLNPLDWLIIWVFSFILVMLLIIFFISCIFKVDAKDKELQLATNTMDGLPSTTVYSLDMPTDISATFDTYHNNECIEGEAMARKEEKKAGMKDALASEIFMPSIRDFEV